MSAAAWSVCEKCAASIKGPYIVLVVDKNAPAGFANMVLCKEHGLGAKRIPQLERTRDAVLAAA